MKSSSISTLVTVAQILMADLLAAGFVIRRLDKSFEPAK